jgi:hypothetical protein
MRNSSIAERLLDAFPSGNYGLVALLRLLDVVESAEVNTAAIECATLPRLLINPNFVRDHADTPERLMMLVMHELHHLLLGHTRLFPRLTPADNLVFDAVINAVLCRMFSGDEHTSLFTRYYHEDMFPECLLRPATAWRPGDPAPVPPALEGRARRRAREVYRALYSETGANYQELYEALRTTLATAGGPPLLGNHGRDLPELTGAIFEAVRSIVERWPQPRNPIAGRSWAEVLDLSRVTHTPSDREVLRSLLRRVAGPGNGTGAGARVHAGFPVVSPLPTVDRRAVVLRALGVPQLLYRREAAAWRRPSCERVHVYLDVSGSIAGFKASLYGAVLDCREIVHPAVHLFSTKVQDVTLHQLRRGECRTTGGTSIECVARHMERHGVRRAVLLTDGAVGHPGETARATLAGGIVGVALTPGYSVRTDLETVTRYWAQLQGEKH